MQKDNSDSPNTSNPKALRYMETQASYSSNHFKGKNAYDFGMEFKGIIFDSGPF